MKRALNINKRTIHYIVELDYLNISKEREVFIKELYKLYTLLQIQICLQYLK